MKDLVVWQLDIRPTKEHIGNMSKRYGEFLDRFWGYVDRFPPEGNGCWLWRGPVDDGYGRMRRGQVKARAHRIMYELQCGEIPQGKVVRHSCDNPACVNPDHLELGTLADNVADMDKRGRRSLIHSAKLTENDVRRIREDSRAERAIAADYGVSHTTIGDIKRGKKWSHL
jgi:hypothetical protein